MASRHQPTAVPLPDRSERRQRDLPSLPVGPAPGDQADQRLHSQAPWPAMQPADLPHCLLLAVHPSVRAARPCNQTAHELLGS